MTTAQQLLKLDTSQAERSARQRIDPLILEWLATKQPGERWRMRELRAYVYRKLAGHCEAESVSRRFRAVAPRYDNDRRGTYWLV